MTNSFFRVTSKTMNSLVRAPRLFTRSAYLVRGGASHSAGTPIPAQTDLAYQTEIPAFSWIVVGFSAVLAGLSFGKISSTKRAQQNHANHH